MALAADPKEAFEKALKANGVAQEWIWKISLKPNGIPSPEKTAAIVQWLKIQGVKDVGKLLAKNPQVLGFDVEKHLDPIATWLRAEGVQNVGKVLSLNPTLLNLKLGETLKPRAEWLKKRGIKDLGKVLSLFPAVLVYNIETNTAPTWGTLTNRLGLSVHDIEKIPSVLGASNSRLSLLVDEVQSLGFDVQSLALTKRLEIIRSVSFEHVLQNLKADGLVRKDLHSFQKLTGEERANLRRLIETGNFEQYLKKTKACDPPFESP